MAALAGATTVVLVLVLVVGLIQQRAGSKPRPTGADLANAAPQLCAATPIDQIGLQNPGLGDFGVWAPIVDVGTGQTALCITNGRDAWADLLQPDHPIEAAGYVKPANSVSPNGHDGYGSFLVVVTQAGLTASVVDGRGTAVAIHNNHLSPPSRVDGPWVLFGDWDPPGTPSVHLIAQDGNRQTVQTLEVPLSFVPTRIQTPAPIANTSTSGSGGPDRQTSSTSR